MEIGIIETHYHEEFLHTLAKIFENENIHIYLTRDVYNNLKKDDINPKYIFYSKNLKRFLRNIPTENFDFFFTNTIQPSNIDAPKWIHFKPKCTSILTIHNLNAWHNNSFVLRKNIFLSFDSYLVRPHLKTILNNHNFINVCYEPMLNFNNSLKPAFTIPYSYALDNIKIKEHDKIKIIVPGTVSNKRRDYKTVIRALHTMTNNIDLVFLGKNEAKYHITGITTYDNYLPTNEYNKIISDADILLFPHVQYTYTVNSALETYGLTKAFNIHEAIKWRKPLIVPFYSPTDPSLASITCKYKNYFGLKTMIQNFIKYPDLLNSLKKQALVATKPFTLNNIKKYVYKEVLKK